MGLYDRDYVRDEPRGFFLGGDRTMVTNLILVNVIVYVADLLFNGELSNVLALKPSALKEPWMLWQLVTYGFLHAPNDFTHILFNMFGLWLFGREVEGLYGRAEFLRIYLAMIVIGGAVWLVSQQFVSVPASGLIGASGAVTGIMVLFAIHDPKRTFYIWGVIPMPVWLLCILYVAQDLRGLTMPSQAEHTAFEVHLTGALLAVIYRQTGMNLGRLVPERWRQGRFIKPPLKVHDPGHEGHEEVDLSKQVDRILEKISREGESSLTREERRTLETASRRYQQRRR